MDKTTILAVGIGGYGEDILGFLFNHANPESYTIVGAVDTAPEKSSYYTRLVGSGVKIYHSIDDFYYTSKADLCIIATPVQLHFEQSLTALKNGSCVLCEKPLVPTLQELKLLKCAAAECGKTLMVGFQMSYTPAVLALKKDVLSGVWGKPLRFSSLISYPRGDSYYAGSAWKGRLKDANGKYILDTVLSNATAHYLHNMLYILGVPRMAAEMSDMSAELYRLKDIETYDTCIIKGNTETGCEIFYAATHSAAPEEYLVQNRFEFEKGTVEFFGGTMCIKGRFNNGSEVTYGNLDEKSYAEKVIRAIEATRGGEVLCSADTVTPHLRCTNALLDMVGINDFPAGTSRASGDYRYIPGLLRDLKQCFSEYLLPSEIGFNWAKPATKCSLAGYTEFSGESFKKS